MNIKFERTRQTKLPQYSSAGAAGIDFFIPYDVKWESKIIPPGGSVLIPSGIKTELPEDVCLIAFNKSGNGIKGLNVGACLIDPDYRGEIHINVFNVSNENILIRNGEKLIQFVALPFIKFNIEETDITTDTDRGANGFGSTGKF